jgi:MATE family multidrug resistance protein
VSELKTLVRHAGTVLVGQLAIMAFGVADTVIAGRHSVEALAALSVGSAIYISVYVALIGIVQALLPIWAEMRGARKHHELGQSVRQSLYLCAAIGLVGTLILLSPGPLLRWAEVPESMMTEVEDYLRILALAFIPSLLFRLYSTLNQALGRPTLVTWLQIAALAVKIPLSIWLVGGGAGVPALGAAGCAWATFIVNYLLLWLALHLLRTQDIYRPYRLWAPMERPDRQQLIEFVRLGLPGGLAYLVEVTSFTLMAVFIARQGMVAAGSHQIAASMAAVLYMVPLSLALAASSRVSFWIGHGDPVQARRLALMGLGLGLACVLTTGGTVALLHEDIAALYSRHEPVVAQAASLLLWVSAYHLADATQALCIFLLRCYRITLQPLLIYGFMLWGVGLAGGYILAYHGLDWGSWQVPAQPSPQTFWLAATVALTVVALSFVVLLLKAMRESLRLPHPTSCLKPP